jgi:hypothetical protein
MIATQTPGSTVRVPLAGVRILAACCMLALLAACSPQSGDGTDSSNGTSESADGGSDSGDGESGGDDGGDGFVPIDPCTLIPDDALATALGSSPVPDREAQAGSGSSLCVIEGTDGNARLSVEITPSGRDGFELFRSYKEGMTDLYQPLTGIGDDAFAFGSEVTVLAGQQVAVLFLEGIAFDNVAPADRLERAKTLALLLVEGLG